MSSSISFDELAGVLGGVPPTGMDAGDELTGVSADSRAVSQGQLFVALRGVVQDGHDHVAEALSAGARLALVADHWPRGSVDERRLWRVPSTLVAYQALAAHSRQKHQVPLVAVTGSVGKTTTKELIAAAMQGLGPVLSTPGNFNNEVGIPQTLLKLSAEHRVVVLELGMRGPGQIAELARIARPSLGVITNVGSAHIGLLGSRQKIAEAKCELLAHLLSDGLAVLHHDPLLIETARSVWSGRTLTFGLDGGDLHGVFQPPGGLIVAGERFRLPLPGAHHALALLATLAVARELGIPWSDLRQLELTLPPGRGRRLERAGAVLLDETYNAGPESMRAALELLAAEPSSRRIAVLGPMLELGDHGPALHREVGRAARELEIDALLVLGDGSEVEALIDGAAPLEGVRFDSHQQLIDYLGITMAPGDVLLFKASRSVGLDRVVAALGGADLQASQQSEESAR